MKVVSEAFGMKLVELEIADIDNNPLNANEQDSKTNNRLGVELESDEGWGEVCVVRPSAVEGRYVILIGQHRIRKWEEQGHKTIIVFLREKPFDDQEKEFEYINNKNLVRGGTSGKKAKRIVREQDLDPTKINLHGMSMNRLFPIVERENLQKKVQDDLDQAAIRRMTVEVAREIATTMLDEKDELVTVLTTLEGRKIGAVLRLAVPSTGVLKKLAPELRTVITTAVQQLLADVETR